MKKIIIYLSAFAVTLLSFSCAKNAVEESAPVPEGYLTVSCTLSDALENNDPDSKVTLSHEGSVGKTRWEAGDEVFFHGAFVGTSGSDKYSCVAAAHDISVDGKTAQFTIPVLAKRFNHDEISWRSEDLKTDLYAAYPASSVSSFSNGAEWYFISSFSNTNHLLLGGCNDIRVNGGLTFEFINLTGALSFKVDGSGEGGFDEYRISGNNGETLGYTNYCIKMDRSTSSNDFRTLYTGSDGPGPSSGALTTISVDSWSGADGTTNNFVYFPNGVNFTNGFTIKFYKGGSEVKRVSTSTPKNIAVGKYLDLGDITSHLYTYTPPPSHDATHPAITGAFDLGAANGTANSYIVYANDPGNANKVFKFKAMKGNSALGVGKIANVSVYWETYNDSNSPTVNSVIAEADFDKQSSDPDYWITFKMPETLHAGNAVIAAKDENDIILWSWHIWVPSNTIADIDASSICGATMMDRNLGALEVVSTSTGASVYSLGLVYEWGRKDPFPGPKRVEKDAGYALVAGVGPTLSGSTMTMTEAIANPTVYGNIASSSDWQTPADLTRWGKTKTQYDPCPPGYKIPYGKRGDKPMWNTSNIKTALTSAGLSWEENYSTGYWFKLSDGVNELVFPIAGYVEENTGTYYSYKNTLRAAIWFLSDSGSSKYHLNIRPSEGTYVFGSTSGARGCNVRCAVE